MDHQPEHGGVFFMAPDRTHHLEGVLLPAGTFKVYLYDDYTRPIPAKGFEAVMQVDGLKEAQKLELLHDLPVKGFPVELTVWITFPAAAGSPPRTELFNFSFDGFSSN